MPRTREEWARALAMAAAASILFSIAAKEILLGAAIVAIVVARLPWRWPRLTLWPLAIFFGLTLVSAAAAGDWRTSLPQLKKFWAYLILPVLATTLRHRGDAERLIGWCVAGGVLSSVWSFGQFGVKYVRAVQEGVPFYLSYVGRRTTGFMSHWMTLGGQLSILIPAALALWLRQTRERRWAWAVGIMTVALMLNLTRGIWIATALAVAYVLWSDRPKLLWILPAAALAALAFEPVRERAISLVRPHGEADSNQHRIVTWRTGLEMVKAHPWLGLGPDEPGKQFMQYIPEGIPRPLPDGSYGHLHNTYLQYAADRGLPALAAFLWFLGALALAWWRSQPEALAQGALGAWIAVAAGGLTEWNLGNTEVLHLFLVVAACADYAVCSKARMS